MSELKFERKETMSRAEAARLLSALAAAFADGEDVELPVGPGTLEVHVPEQVHGELEVEVDGDEVEIEIEFSWSRKAAPA
ncbi:MAG: amphi-Trp domain-containing protein [Motilibacteraceae bacterium]